MNFTAMELLEMAKENGDLATLCNAGRRPYSKTEHNVAKLIAANARHMSKSLPTNHVREPGQPALSSVISEAEEAERIWRHYLLTEED